MADTEKQKKWAWDRQWRGNLLSTCGHHIDPETGAALAQDWIAFFADLPNGARIVDVGTGNGIIPFLAQNLSDQANKDFDIHGTDLAVINPADVVADHASQLSKVTFHAETPTEKLPFKDGTVDAVTSQHAIEYGDLDASMKEVARVLKSGGCVRFLVHASEGVIVQSNLPKIEQCRYVLEDAKLFEATAQAAGPAGKGDGSAALQAALKTTADKFQHDPNTYDLMELLGLLWGAYEQREHFPNQEAFKTWLEENKKETQAQKLRIEAMRDAALGEAEAKELESTLTGLGFKDAHLAPVKGPDGQHLFGWLLEAEKNT